MTKYTLPPERPGLVARERLLNRLLAGLNGRLTLIAAPPGFGKSTLAAEFARRAGRPAAWLGLEASDNEPSRFGAYLAAAVAKAGVSLQSELPLEELMGLLVNAAVETPLVLVLDDYQVIETPEIHAAVGLFLERMPSNLHLVIATRSRPPLPLARLKARGDMTELNASDLRFTADEAARLLGRAPLADLIYQRTEGWVTGMQLALLSSDPAAALSGYNPDLLEYLVDEVIRRQPPAVQTFLLRTAVLGRLTGPLCDALTGQTEGARTLQALERANLFLFPLDPERRWFRYHQLFREFLLARLREETGEAGVAGQHRRAAEWHRAEGQFTEAVDHLLDAGDFDRAADWMEEAAPERRWLDRLPPEV
ncbi:MAG TPA: hypothetical protein VNT75_15120, partial [Symbiobacteriaceae bacterium]|nr:hypothetical protein [Symbiobacteriaceae bacterium]